MLKIHSKVMTEWGEGTLISVKTPFTGLHVYTDDAKCVVWFGSENPGKREGDGANWITREIPLRELIGLNSEVIRDEKINDILHARRTRTENNDRLCEHKVKRN